MLSIGNVPILLKITGILNIIVVRSVKIHRLAAVETEIRTLRKPQAF